MCCGPSCSISTAPSAIPDRGGGVNPALPGHGVASAQGGVHAALCSISTAPFAIPDRGGGVNPARPGHGTASAQGGVHAALWSVSTAPSAIPDPFQKGVGRVFTPPPAQIMVNASLTKNANRLFLREKVKCPRADTPPFPFSTPYSAANWFIVLPCPPAFKARSPATISLNVSPRSDPTSC